MLPGLGTSYPEVTAEAGEMFPAAGARRRAAGGGPGQKDPAQPLFADLQGSSRYATAGGFLRAMPA
jgi:hypothetical protein